MGRHFRHSSVHPNPNSCPETIRGRLPMSDLASPFGRIESLDEDDIRSTAYEILFTSCRSYPGFGGRSAINYYNCASDDGTGPNSPRKAGELGPAVVTSRLKRALGLKMAGRSPTSRRSYSFDLNPSPDDSSPQKAFNTAPIGGNRLRRPLTAAEIMRQQLNVSEQNDNRLRKTLMRTLVGQTMKRAETIILPLELMRHLKPSEFRNAHEYHLWQIQQLKLLEAGLLLHPSIPLDKSDANAAKLREIIISSESNPIDTLKTSETMKALSNCTVSLAWRGCHHNTTDIAHWIDGYPLNLKIYDALLSTIFDLKDETSVLDEVDELLELIKKTWSVLGLNRSMHNLCLTWVFFERYVATGLREPDLLNASFVMLTEVAAADAKKADREPVYIEMLGSVLRSMKKWLEKRLLDYHGCFGKESVGVMENMLPILFSVKKILEDEHIGDEEAGVGADHYIRSSLRIAFSKIVEEQNTTKTAEVQDPSEALIRLAKKTKELAAKEKAVFSPAMKKWHPIATGVAAVSLHGFYGSLLKKYMAANPFLVNETILVLQRAGKLEKTLVQLVVEDSVDCEDGGKAIVREMVPYEVETIIHRLMKQRIQERLQKGREYILRAKQTETWNPKSKMEPYARSAEEFVGFAKEAAENFFEINVNVSESLFRDFVDGLGSLFREFVAFVACCASKQSYIPTLPPVTRCSRDSKFLQLWKKAGCSVGVDYPNRIISDEEIKPRPSTSRGTQRLYIRLNTLNYLEAELRSLNKLLQGKARFSSGIPANVSCFEATHSSIHEASHHVSEVAAYRLIFLDSTGVLYSGLYVGDVANSRIRLAIRTLKQNVRLLCVIVAEKAQPLALKEVMKASFQSFLLVLLAGGNSRHFSKADHAMIEEDLESLKKMFCNCGEGLIVEDMVESEGEAAESVVSLMSLTTEQLIEEFYHVSGLDGCTAEEAGEKLPLPPLPAGVGEWSRFDPDTILRVLCYRDDRAANQFLKKTFNLAKRRPAIRII
ncbi:hypothetical protein M569_04598 [Genlisea aurea]|uniref:MHD1 domain-containing protein n=1 Tax=Genlisea aurea TaxID=192259 RepID=S8CTI4_9LAMI|nr:hypothetical protein M569_04598 [Genlisea aurea]